MKDELGDEKWHSTLAVTQGGLFKGKYKEAQESMEIA